MAQLLEHEDQHHYDDRIACNSPQFEHWLTRSNKYHQCLPPNSQFANTSGISSEAGLFWSIHFSKMILSTSSLKIAKH